MIGPNSIIENSYIFEGTVVGADCRITRSIVGANAEIKDGSVIERGSLIGDKVILGPGAKLKPFDRVSLPFKEFLEDAKVEESEVKSDHSGSNQEEEEVFSEEEEDSDIEEVEERRSSNHLLLHWR